MNGQRRCAICRGPNLTGRILCSTCAEPNQERVAQIRVEKVAGIYWRPQRRNDD